MLSAQHLDLSKEFNLPNEKYHVINLDLQKHNIDIIDNALLSIEEGGLIN